MPPKRKYNLPDVDANIGMTLSRIRKENGLTQKELADLTGISQQHQSHYEKGDIHITAEMIVRYSNALNVSCDRLLNTEEQPNKSPVISLRFTKRMQEIERLPEGKKRSILQVLDDLIRANN